MTSGRDIFDFSEEEETSDVDDETGHWQLDDHPSSTHSTITIESTASLAEETREIPWEQECLETPLRTIIARTLEVRGEGCQELGHRLSRCRHQADWSSCQVHSSNTRVELDMYLICITVQVDIQTLLSPVWQADNPWINPAPLFKELNRVMKIRLEEYAEKLTDITTDIISLTSSNALVNRCNEGLFSQMQQDRDEFERQLQDLSKQVNIFIGEQAN